MEVIAGFLVLAKRGLILSLRTCSTTGHKEEFASARIVVVNKCSSSAAFAVHSFVVHGSFSVVKLASAMTMSGLLVAFSTGNITASDEITDMERDDLSRLELMLSFFSAISRTCQWFQ